MTQHHHTPPPDPMPLDPEERALAARLARLGPHGEPSPSLDARVLAAAHAAATAQHARRARGQGWRRARWPVGVGVAASVVLAAGIAWQMRPLPAPQFRTGAAAPEVAATASGPGSTNSMSASDARTASAAQGMSGPPLQETAAATAGAEDNAGRASAASAGDVAAAKALAPPAPPPPPPASEPPVVFDAPSPVDVAAPPPAPPAPSAPPAAAARQASAAQAANDAQAAQAPQSVSAASDADAPEGDVPPATVASPEVRDAWLARIRELAAIGRTDEARASLAEFRRRYPAFAIPPDLRPLLPPATPGSTPAATPAPASTPR